MTKREYFETIMNLVADNEELVTMTAHEIEMLDKRNSYKTSKEKAKNAENEAIKEEILMVLSSATEPMSTKNIIALIDKPLSPQKITALMVQLMKAEKVNREYDKKTAVYTIA